MPRAAGTVVNFMGVSQSYSPALKPKGQALSHAETIKKLALLPDKNRVSKDLRNRG